MHQHRHSRQQKRAISLDINKQTIIVTKSFLIEDADGNSKLDKERLKEIDAKKYRIEKKRPFDEKDLSTIQTTVESI